MRLFALLFAFYFACLSTLTCTDEISVCKDQARSTVTAAPHSDCGGNMIGGDWCSPLCQCRCCGGAVVLTATPPLLAYQLMPVWGTTQRHAPLVVASPIQLAGDVWQPPQA
jgi:hypothetical protein